MGTVKLNTRHLPRILYNFGLSDKPGIFNFTQDHCNVGGTYLSNGTRCDGMNVMVNTLDNISFTRNISVIKMDVEGLEEQVLIGGSNMLAKNKPTLIIEIWPLNVQKVSNLLLSMGYVQIDNKNDDYVFVPNAQ